MAKQLHQHSEDTRIALLEQSINNINNTMIRFENKFDKIDSKIDSKFNRLVGWIIGLYGITIISGITYFASRH